LLGQAVPCFLAWTESNGNLDYWITGGSWWQTAGSSTWHQEQVAAGEPGGPYSGAAIAWTGSSVVITSTDSNGNLNYWWHPGGSSTTWHQEQVAAASGQVTYYPVDIAWTGSFVIITGTDSNGHLNYWWQPASGSTWHQGEVANHVTTP